MYKTIYGFLFLSQLIFAQPNIVFVHGLNSSSNTFLKMASELSSELGNENFMKWGFEHSLLDNKRCWTYDIEDYNDLCKDGTDGFLFLGGDESYYTSKNHFSRIYGLNSDGFLMEKIYFRYLHTETFYNYFSKYEEAITSSLYSMNEFSSYYKYDESNNRWVPTINYNDSYINNNYINNQKPLVHILNISNNKNLTFSSQGKELKYMLMNISEYTKNNDFILVGHSMGGLAIRSLVQNENVDLNISKIITIGTPHNGAGSDIGAFTKGEAVANLDSNSEAIQVINSFDTKVYENIEFFSFVITGHTGKFYEDEVDIVSGNKDDGVVKEYSQIAPLNISDEILYFSPDCIGYDNCIKTINPINHIRETGNKFIIEKILEKVIINNEKNINLSTGWNLISFDMNLSQIPNNVSLVWQFINNKWFAYSRSGKFTNAIDSLNIKIEEDILKSSMGTWLLTEDNITMKIINKNEDIKYEQFTTSGWNLLGTNKNIKAKDITCKNNDTAIIFKYENNEWLLFTNLEIFNSKNKFDDIYENTGFWLWCK